MSDIAINPVTRRVQFTGNTGTGPYAFTFNVLQSSDIVVYKNNVLLTETTDYTVSIAANGTGNITMVVALVLTDILTIIGGRELSRTTDFVTAGDLLASSLNEQLDSNVIMSQQLDERFGRTLAVPPGDEDKTLDLPLAADRADKIILFDESGNVTAAAPSDFFGNAVLGGNFIVNTATGDGSQTAFGLTVAPGIKTNIQIHIDGVYQNKATFSLSGSTVTFTEAPPLNAAIEFMMGESVTTITGDASAITYNQGGTGAQDRTVRGKLQETVSVKDFGAVGDGVTDDTAAIQAAIDYLDAGNGGVVYLGRGKYRITTSLDLKGNILLRGEGHMRYNETAVNNCATYIIKDGNFEGVYLRDLCGLEYVTVLGASGNGNDGIVFRGGRAFLTNVGSIGHGGVGIKVGKSGDNCNLWKITNCVVRDNNSHGLYVDDPDNANPDTNAGLLLGIECRENGGDGVRVENAIDNTFINIQTFENTGVGVHLVFRSSCKCNGHTIINTYDELNVGGASIIDAGCIRNRIIGRNSGSGQWTVNDSNNYVLGNDPNFETQMGFYDGFFFEGDGTDQNYEVNLSGDNLYTQALKAATSAVHRYFSNDGDGTDSVQLELYSEGSPSDISDRSRLVLGYDVGSTEYKLQTNSAGSGTTRGLRLEVGGSGVNEVLFEQNDITLICPEGIGDGSATNLQAPAQGTGGGPSSLTVSKFIRVKRADGTRGFIPFFDE